MGFEADSTGVQLAIEALDVGLEKRPLNLDGEVADAQVKQLLIAETMPGESVAHGGQDSSDRVAMGQNKEDFSRKGAKTQSKTSGSRRGFPLRLCAFAGEIFLEPFTLSLARLQLRTQIWRLPIKHDAQSGEEPLGLCSKRHYSELRFQSAAC
jgi:hypothetical protein